MASNQPPSLMPRRKVAVGAIAGAIVTLAVGIGEVFGGHDIGGVQGAAAVLIISTLLAYIVPEGDQA